MSKYFFDFRPDFNLFNSDTKRATTIYYTVPVGGINLVHT